MRAHRQRRLPFNVANAATRVGRPLAPRVTLTCSRCHVDFQRYASAVRQRPSARVFCPACYQLARQAGLNPRRSTTPIRELDRRHNGRPVRITHQGYLAVYEPDFAGDHQWRSLPIGYHYEHRVVATRMIGRPLRRHETVHHKNEIKTDNRPENLMVVTRSEHNRIHEAIRADERRRLAEYERRYGPLECNDAPLWPNTTARIGVHAAVGVPCDRLRQPSWRLADWQPLVDERVIMRLA